MLYRGVLNKKSNTRFYILGFLFINVVINYMDRSNISIAATSISKEWSLSPFELGLIFSAFGWAYAALQIPGGILADRVSPRILYSAILVAWSISTLLQGLLSGFVTLFLLRLATGAFESPAYPTNNKIVSSWFPLKERASAIAVYTSGQFIGLAFLTPALTTLQYYLGWQWLFIITGMVGIGWGIAWYFLYRNAPKDDSAKQERSIANHSANRQPIFTWDNLKKVFSYRKLWGIYLGQFCLTSTLWFFLTWFPTYLTQYRHINLLKTGFLASIPFMGAFVGILTSGFLSDRLLKKGKSLAYSRKFPVISGLLLSTAMIGANYTSDTSLIILFMTLAFLGNGVASISWVFVSSLSPPGLIGLTGGVFNFFGNLSSIFIPIVVGSLASNGDFDLAVVFISLMSIAGACCYIFLVGKMNESQQ